MVPAAVSAWGSCLYSGKRVLVFGAGGFVGQNLVRKLKGAEAIVFSAVRSPRTSVLGCQVPVDVAVRGVAEQLIDELRPDIVFNLAAYGVNPTERDPVVARRINGELPGEIGAAASHISTAWDGLKFVHVGSALEYGAGASDLDEDSDPVPTTLYGETKLAGVRAVSEVGENCVTVRLFTVYGPGEAHGRLLPSLLHAAQTNSHISLTEGRQQRDFTFVGDVAEGLLRVGSARWRREYFGKQGPIVNLATGNLFSVKHFVLEAARVIGLGPSQLGFGELPTRNEEMAHLPVTVKRLKAWIGWQAKTDIAEGIRLTIGDQ